MRVRTADFPSVETQIVSRDLPYGFGFRIEDPEPHDGTLGNGCALRQSRAEYGLWGACRLVWSEAYVLSSWRDHSLQMTVRVESALAKGS